jgi:hypothetical protein
MSVPSEIRRLFEAEPQAHAALSCSLHGPIGETHLVVANGQLFLFTRESLIGQFTRLALDPHRGPALEPGDFADILHVQLADGATFELTVSSFERDAVAQALATASVLEPTAAALPPGEPPTAAPDLLSADFSVTASLPATQAFETPPREPTTATPDPEDDQAGKEPATYEASTLRLMPCLGMMLFFFGPMVGIWFAHDAALQALTQMSPGKREAGTFLFVITKILAMVAGIYAGVKLLTLFNKFGTSRNWDGQVIFDRHGMKLTGPSNKWEITIDRSRPFELSCECHTEKPAGGQESSRRRQIYYLHIHQQGDNATLRTTLHAASPEPMIAGAQVAPIDAEKETPNTLAMDEKTFRRVAARLRKLAESVARSGSAGDNQRA